MLNNCAEGFGNRKLLYLMLNENSIQRGAEWILKMNFQRIKLANQFKCAEWDTREVMMSYYISMLNLRWVTIQVKGIDRVRYIKVFFVYEAKIRSMQRCMRALFLRKLPPHSVDLLLVFRGRFIGECCSWPNSDLKLAWICSCSAYKCDLKNPLNLKVFNIGPWGIKLKSELRNASI